MERAYNSLKKYQMLVFYIQKEKVYKEREKVSI